MRYGRVRCSKYFTIKILFCLVTMLACFLGVFKFMPTMIADATVEKVVRVGYYEEDGIQMGGDDGAVKSGYAYDYYQRLKLYSNWKYEYVYGPYGELYEKLINGEIDLLAGLAYKPERTAVLSYPQDPMGASQYLFFKRSSNEYVTSELESLNGKRIGVLTGAQVKVVEKYLSTHNIQAEVVVYDDLKEQDEAVKRGYVDVILAEGYNTFKDMKLEVCFEAGTSDFYLVVNKARPDILADLNRAQHRLNLENPHFISDLTRKWFKRTIFTTNLSTTERKWLAEHKTFVVGCFNNYLPYSAFDEDGNVNGVVKDIVPEIFKALNIWDIDVQYKGYDSFEELAKALKNHEVDVIFPAISHYWIAEKADMLPTDPVINTQFNILYKGEYPDMSKARIAVSKTNSVMDSYRAVYYPNNKAQYYGSDEECINAISRGEADVMLVGSIRAEYLLRDKDKDLNIAQLNSDTAIGFVGLNSESEGIGVLNHGLSLMDKDYIFNRSYAYLPSHDMSIGEFLKKNVWVPVGGLVVLFSLIIFFIARENRRNQEHLRETEEQYEETRALNEELQTQHARMEEAMAAAEIANNAKSTFLFNMSHDIRTPLNAIIGFTELAERDPDNVEHNKEYRKKVKLASHQLLDILDNVLEMARIENNKLIIDEEVVDFNVLFNSWLAVFEGEMMKKNLKFESSFDIEHQFLYTDRIHVSEVVMNVISNSVKYTPEGGTIFVGVKELPGANEAECNIEFVVRDTGIGMSEEFVSEIFEQFTRAYNSTQNGIQGTGLGMAIVKSILDKMNGTITVKSKLGEGTEIVFTIPHRIGKAQSMVVDKEKQLEVVDFSGKRLLLTEDNDLNAEIAITILEESGLEVERAKDGVECIDMLTNHEAGYYDLILMDIQMPNLDGYGATRKIRELDDPDLANIPIIAMTANAFKEDQEKAFAMGMNDHLAKPIDVTKIFKALKNVLH